MITCYEPRLPQVIKLRGVPSAVKAYHTTGSTPAIPTPKEPSNTTSGGGYRHRLAELALAPSCPAFDSAG